MPERWMTYAELGERLGASPEAARQLVIRLRLRRRKDNVDSKVRVLVDPEDIEARRRSTPVRTPRRSGVGQPYEQASDAKLVSALEAHLQTLREQAGRDREASATALRALQDQLDRERGRAEAAERQVAAAEQRERQLQAERAAEAERQRQDLAALALRLDQAQRDRAAAEAALGEWRARPWWRRLWQR